MLASSTSCHMESQSWCLKSSQRRNKAKQRVFLTIFVFIFFSFTPCCAVESHQDGYFWISDRWRFMCEECAMTLLISELMAYEFEGGDWLIRQMAISQQLMHIDMVKGSINVWLTASFVCCIYGFVCLSGELLMCCNLWTCRSRQIALIEQFRDFTSLTASPNSTIVLNLMVGFATWKVWTFKIWNCNWSWHFFSLQSITVTTRRVLCWVHISI